MVCAEAFHAYEEDIRHGGYDVKTLSDRGVVQTMATKMSGLWLEEIDDRERVQEIHRKCP